MKKILSIIVILSFLTTLTSCSSDEEFRQGADASKDDVAEVASDDSEFLVDDSDFVVEEKDEIIKEGSQEVAAVEQAMPEETKQEIAVEAAAVEEIYEIRKGETLMWVAFKLYGDYRKWRELKAANGINGGLKVGTKLKYVPSDFMWNPSGMPHLIKSGETLGIISNEKYGTSKKWKKIWNNNKEMILDPNLIFAGFTLYYEPEERKIASEQ